MRSTTWLCLTMTVLAAPVLGAQSRGERAAERATERIGEIVQRTIDRTMREVGRQLDAWSQYGDDDLQQVGNRVDTTFAFSRGGVVDLTSLTGDITVTGWSRGEAHVKASTERGTLRLHLSSSRITIEGEPLHGRTGDTQFDVTVPEGTRVVMRSTSGSLTTRGVKGRVEAGTTSGDITVVDASDRIELQTVSGDVHASRLNGEVEAGTVSGEVVVDDVEGPSVQLESTGGTITLTGIRSRDVSASTVSGDVDFRGTVDPRGDYEFRTHSGTITLAIPAGTSARFGVQTYSGNLDSQFPITLQPGRDRLRNRRLEFTLGGGDARVEAQTFSGNINIRRSSGR